MRHAVLALFTALTVILAPLPAARAADQPGNSREEAQRLLDEATRKVMRAFELMLMAIPQYAAPEILDNGDIIIRRIHPKPKKGEKDGDEPPPHAPEDSTRI